MLPAFPEALYRLKLLNQDRRLSLSSLLILVCIGKLSAESQVDPWLCLCLGFAVLNYNAKRAADFILARRRDEHRERMALIAASTLEQNDKMKKQVDEIERELRSLIMASRM